MSWILKGLTGDLKDKTFALKVGLTLGRQGANVVIANNKASSIHARISQDADGHWLLEDNNSKNGIRFNGDRIGSLILKSGVVFEIAEHAFMAMELKAEAEAKPVLNKNQRYWYEVLATHLKENKGEFRDRAIPVRPLEPALVLEFVRGVQTNSRWVLGYGPRKIGPSSIDLPIWEPGAPAVCFEVLPTSEGLVFKTQHPDLVLLNGDGVDSQTLRAGDNIRILDTIIEVDFVE